MSARKSIAWLLLLAMLAGAGFFGVRALLHWQSLREKSCCRAPEIAWMREELKLGEADFKKVEDLHLAYLPVCHGMCDRILASGKRLKDLADARRSVSAELEAAMVEDEKVRAECRLAMLRHLYDTAAVMTPEAGQRFLRLTLPAVLSPDHPTIGDAVSH